MAKGRFIEPFSFSMRGLQPVHLQQDQRDMSNVLYIKQTQAQPTKTKMGKEMLTIEGVTKELLNVFFKNQCNVVQLIGKIKFYLSSTAAADTLKPFSQSINVRM